MIVQPVVEPMEHYTALHIIIPSLTLLITKHIVQIIEDMIVNKKMKNRLTQANIDPYSSEGRYGLLNHRKECVGAPKKNEGRAEAAKILRMALSSLSRSEIYCRFVLENPRDVDSAVDLELEDLITAATAVVHMVAILLLYVPNVITWVQ